MCLPIVTENAEKAVADAKEMASILKITLKFYLNFILFRKVQNFTYQLITLLPSYYIILTAVLNSYYSSFLFMLYLQTRCVNSQLMCKVVYPLYSFANMHFLSKIINWKSVSITFLPFYNITYYLIKGKIRAK